MKAAITSLSKQNPLLLAGAAAILIYVVYGLIRKTVKDTADAAGGLVSGNTPWTTGTPYENTGILGTLGGGIDKVTGGVASAAGGWIAGLLASDYVGEDLFFTTTFPDGAKHAVPSSTVARDGRFTYGGKNYIMGSQGIYHVARAA